MNQSERKKNSTNPKEIDEIANRIRAVAFFLAICLICLFFVAVSAIFQYDKRIMPFFDSAIWAIGFLVVSSVFLFILENAFRNGRKWTFGIVEYIVFTNPVIFGRSLAKRLKSDEIRVIFGLEPNIDLSSEESARDETFRRN